MARGESPKERPLSIGIAIMAVVGVASLCAIFSVINSIRTASPLTTPPYGMSGVAEPFRGATTAFGTLSSRDSARAILTSGTTLARDPTSARSTLTGALRDRGYVEGATRQTAPEALPFDATPADLDGACGVVLLVGDLSTTISSAGITGGTAFRAVDPSAFTVAMCGTGSIHAAGTGNVTMQTWLLPGLTPGALTDTGLSADVLLAHAEMELVLRRRGYAPVDEIVEIAPITTTAGGFLTLTPPTMPSAGCIPFVVYIEGAGRPEITPGRFDFLDDRGLSGAVWCATTSSGWEPRYVDDATVGARVFARAYASAPSGSGTTLSIAAARSVDPAHATWPAAISGN